MKQSVLFLLLIFNFALDPVKAESCTIEATGRLGECKFMAECPAIQAEYQKTKKLPTLCDRKYRTVCCPSASVPPPTTPTPLASPMPKRISEKKCQEYGQFIYETVSIENPILGEAPIVKKVDTCAHKSVELIVGGEVAREREFPHMALIGYKQGKPNDYQCGGSLISSQWILTAAHCARTTDGPATFAKIGNVVRGQENPNTWTYSIIERVPHPNYVSRLAENDIALLKLHEPAKLNRYVIPICLPQTATVTTKRAIASGWGRTGFAEDASEVLMKVTIDFFDQKRCDDVYEYDEKLDGKGINWEKMLCAGSTNKTGDTCNGDSGGPLQIFNSQVECMYSIVGVTSFGSLYCGAIGIPAIYTKVNHYLDWIESVVWPNQQ